MKINIINTPSIVLSLIVVGLFAGTYFIYENMVTRGQDIFALSQQSAKNTQYQQETKDLAASLNTFAPEISSLDSYFVASDGEVSFIELVENLAKADKLDVKIES